MKNRDKENSHQKVPLPQENRRQPMPSLDQNYLSESGRALLQQQMQLCATIHEKRVLEQGALE